MTLRLNYMIYYKRRNRRIISNNLHFHRTIVKQKAFTNGKIKNFGLFCNIDQLPVS
jgi:hypothetical protein